MLRGAEERSCGGHERQCKRQCKRGVWPRPHECPLYALVSIDLAMIDEHGRVHVGRARTRAVDYRPVFRASLEADARTRTGDPFITSEVLYQLSYVGEAEAV